MESLTDYRARRRLPDLPIAAASILGFWLFYFATVVIRTLLIDESLLWLGYRALGCVIGILLTFLVYVVLSRAARESVRIQIVAAAIACVPAAAIFSTFNLAFAVQQPLVERTVIRHLPGGGTVVRSTPRDEVRIGRDGVQIVTPLPGEPERRRQQIIRLIADGLVTWYFFFAAWASFYIAISSATRLRAAERRAAGAERDAQEAQLRALRYQVNPHFLFNTLNSLSSLVMARRDEEAEAMIVNLSTFFRSSLTLDPSEDIGLAQEIEFQQLYLDIEKLRFPRRLEVRIEVPADLRPARVPPLILQPLVENAIKHGVAPSREPVSINIHAHVDEDALCIRVENCITPDAEINPVGKKVPGRHGVGLMNVRRRLEAVYGQSATLTAGTTENSFVATICIPKIQRAS